MAYLDTAHFDDKTQPGLAWEALTAQLDLGRMRLPRPALELAETKHVKFVQQMLLAAIGASGAIIAIAGVMLLRLI